MVRLDIRCACLYLLRKENCHLRLKVPVRFVKESKSEVQWEVKSIMKVSKNVFHHEGGGKKAV
jgi:hypothetical protein